MQESTAKKQPDPDEVRKAKKAFFVNLFDLSWRLLGAMLVPIFIGLFIDSKAGTDKTFALVGFVIGMIAGVFIIRSMIKKISEKGLN